MNKFTRTLIATLAVAALPLISIAADASKKVGRAAFKRNMRTHKIGAPLAVRDKPVRGRAGIKQQGRFLQRMGAGVAVPYLGAARLHEMQLPIGLCPIQRVNAAQRAGLEGAGTD